MPPPNRLAPDSALHIPHKVNLVLNDNDTTPQIFAKDTLLYLYANGGYHLIGGGTGGSGAVASVFGRAGVVTSQTGDYTAAQVTNAVDQTGGYSNPTWLTSLAWLKITGPPNTVSGYGITDAVTLTGTQTLTNKTLTAPVINVGSDATADMYYRNSSGNFTRLGIGSNGQILVVSGGLPSWGSSTAGVTSFASGSASPLFTTNVTGATSTVSQTFSLTAAGPYTFFGNYTGSSATPGYYTFPNSYYQNGLTSLNDSTTLFGGRLNQNTTVSLANAYAMVFDSAQAASGHGFKVNFIGDAGWDLFTKDSATGYWTRIPKGTVGQSLQMLSSGGIGWANQASGGGNSNAVGQDSAQSVTSGSTVTQASGYNVIYVNPSAVLPTLTITTATTFHASNKLTIVFGGSIASGNPVVNSISIVAGSGLTLVQAVNPNGNTMYSGETIEYKKVGSYLYRTN